LVGTGHERKLGAVRPKRWTGEEPGSSPAGRRGRHPAGARPLGALSDSDPRPHRRRDRACVDPARWRRWRRRDVVHRDL